ncbi:MAG: sugar phosphate isomerase/epimerase [Alphaproteobacteria bacterium]|nr:sugar phosphate isomerase/epimerase [Alphaproteobacteria bacterium]
MADIRNRIGVDVSGKLSTEAAVEWGVENDVAYIDTRIDIAPNPLERFTDPVCEAIRARCEETGIRLGLHTLSAVNIAEVSPYLRDAVDAYLRGYIDAAARMNAAWVEVHAGYHFSDDKQLRMDAGLEHLKRAAGYAEEKGVQLLLENLNPEPDRAEVHYLAHDIEECLFYFNGISSPALAWSFTINHASLTPEGIAGFLDALPTDRLAEVRVADSNGEYEQHMQPGDGMIDFPDMFARIEAAGFTGHYMCAFGSLEDMLRGRDWMADRFPS